MKAVVIVMHTDDDQVATDVARLLGAALTLNGYDFAGPPAVIDWPLEHVAAPAAEVVGIHP